MKNSFVSSIPTFEFHVAKKLREKYGLDESFFSLTGNVIFANFYHVRLFVQKINDKRKLSDHLSPEVVNAAGLLDEIYHIAIKNYLKKLFPNCFSNALASLHINLGGNNLDNLLLDFVKIFPPQQVYSKKQTEKEYLSEYTDSISNREILLEELMLLHFANRNPAFHKIKELFDENYLEEKSAYKLALNQLKEFFKNDDLTIGINNTDLFDFLSMPFIKHSDSIWDQLEYIKNEWGIFIDQKLLDKIQSSKDLFRESIKFEPQFGGGGNPTIVPKYKGRLLDADHLVIGKSGFRYAEDSAKEYDEPEQFTRDISWMPNLVLIAKNIYVWLDQLSKKYQREIKTLDQIPIEELAQLQKWNTNGLWLIGIWERSFASKKIKHLMGNIDAEASAYSLYDYQIANDLGGEEAYHIFNENAKRCGIRLASDMVPNHTGIFSKWMIEHPEYYIQSDHSPFPNYSFTGENLSRHSDIEIRIEDQYWEMKDAAVVFERKDLRSGEVKYMYHGNDGTVMPWNDTAQLNLMKHEVREALIQKIFEVARKFSVIRFDAAMTLAKKHFARLWFPEPGKGGDIPSRADHAMSRQQFDELFPIEFWREVVDRINKEMPETLLLAEAFWLMEGYFVRTLGMHRVYNSAFMHMMMNEENNKYRELITNTLEFEPEILKRYVNFMSNPDEETAIDQFGSEDKYFGVLILMITLPGLPMFAHGQIEGFTEKYGMEYKRAYYNEQPKQWLIEKHEREIFPVLKKRYIFSEVQNFWIYDFLDKAGNVNENIFVFSNEFYGQKGLVIFNNKFEAASGSVHFSRQKLNGNSSSSNELHNTNIAYSLGIKNSDDHYYILKDITSGLEYFYNGFELHRNGLFANLNGFEYRVFLKFEEIIDSKKEMHQYYKSNYGIGKYDIKYELEKIKLAPVHEAFENLFSNEMLEEYFNLFVSQKNIRKNVKLFTNDVNKNLSIFLSAISEQITFTSDENNFRKNYLYDLSDSLEFIQLIRSELKPKRSKVDTKLLQFFGKDVNERWLVILLFKTISQLKELFKENDELRKTYIADLILTKPIKSILSKNAKIPDNIGNQILLINILLQFENAFDQLEEVSEDYLKLRSAKKLYNHIQTNNKEFLTEIVNKELLTTYLDVNVYEGKTYFSKERLDELIDLVNVCSVFNYFGIVKSKYKTKTKQKTEIIKFLKKAHTVNMFIKKQATASNYLFNDLLEKLELNS